MTTPPPLKAIPVTPPPLKPSAVKPPPLKPTVPHGAQPPTASEPLDVASCVNEADPTAPFLKHAAIGVSCIALFFITASGVILLKKGDNKPKPTPVAAVTMPLTTPAVEPATVVPVVAKAPEAEPAPAADPVKPKKMKPTALKTPMLGSTTGGMKFEKYSKTREPLLGFRIESARWGKTSIIRTLEPIWASDNLVITPSMTIAKPGYAVSGIIVDGDTQVTAMKVQFMRLDGPRLNPADTYETPWFGEPTGAPLTLLGGRGEHVVGIYGRKGMNFDAIGLYQVAYTEQ